MVCAGVGGGRGVRCGGVGGGVDRSGERPADWRVIYV